MEIDLSSPEPLYLQIAEMIRTERLTGRWRSGDRVPTVRDMALALRINPNTVAKAYKLLQEEGVLASRPGGGNYIVPLTQDTLRGERLRRLDAELENLLKKTDALGIPRKDVLLRLSGKIQGGLPP